MSDTIHTIPATPSEGDGGRALVVYESMFGNSEQVARAVADELRDVGYDVTLASVTAPSVPRGRIDVDLVVAGAPTHAFSLSRPSTRQDAVRQGAHARNVAIGLREWLESASPARDRAVPLAVFDTRVEKVRRLPMAAGPAARRLARRRGFEVTRKPAAFLVEDTDGPLVDGELERARDWAASLVAARPVPRG